MGHERSKLPAHDQKLRQPCRVREVIHCMADEGSCNMGTPRSVHGFENKMVTECMDILCNALVLPCVVGAFQAAVAQIT